MEKIDQHNPRTLEIEHGRAGIPSRRCDQGERSGGEVPRDFDSWSHFDGTCVFSLEGSWRANAFIPPQSLESWSTSPEYRAFFRQKVWGGFQMLSQVTFNREKWLSSLLLHPVTGLDPEGVKVRASEGFDAASSFIQGYWIWQVILAPCVASYTHNVSGRRSLRTSLQSTTTRITWY